MTTDTFGDRRQDLPIPEIGGKGVFSKEIQELVLAGEADVAVHSAKDLQAVTPEGLTIAAFTDRGDPRDALVGHTLVDLPAGATVATGSNRRSALIRALRPDLHIVGLRGNIATRLSRLGTPAGVGSGSDGADGATEGRTVDALILAATALDRLGVSPASVERLDPESFVPQVGQGALAVEVRRGDDPVIELVQAINHRVTALAVTAERSFLAELGGDCNLPAGAYAELTTDGAGTGSSADSCADSESSPVVRIRGVLAAADGSCLQRAQEVAPICDDPGRALARTLRKMLEAAAPVDA